MNNPTIQQVNDIINELDNEFAETADNVPNANEDINTYEESDINDNVEPDTNTGNNITDTIEPEPATVSTSKRKSLSKLVRPKHAVNVVDWIIPTVIVFIVDKMGYSIYKKDLQLDKDEKELLQPFVEDFLNEIQIDLSNPYVNLAVGITIVYGMKVLDAKPKRKTDITPVEDLSEAAQFEKEYNVCIEEILRTEKAKGRLTAMKYFAESEPEKLRSLMEKYNYTDDKYLRYSKIYMKELNQKKYDTFKL